MTIIFFKNLLKCLPSTAAISTPDHRRLLPPPATANTSAASTITKNFNSLYDISSAYTSKSLSSPSSRSFSPSDSDSDPDFAAAVASQRFFFSSPGRSNSILDPPETAADPDSPPWIGGGIAVKKLSPDPYADFRDSMREMIEARKVRDVKTDWEFLQELLCCYLNLNPKSTHKIIISAFSDIVICLLSSSPPESGGGCSVC